MTSVRQEGGEAPESGRAIPTLLLIESFDANGHVRELLGGARDILRVAHAPTLAAGLTTLRDTAVNAVLVDLGLSDCRDVSVVDRLREAAPDAAIMMLATAEDQALARRAVDHGANDFVVTDQIDTRSLVPADRDDVRAPRSIEQQSLSSASAPRSRCNSIGDAVMTTDTQGNVTYLNAEAEALTGWTRAEAFARPLAEVFDVTDGLTGQHARDPSRLAIEHRTKVRLKGNYILVGRDGHETADRAFGGADSRSPGPHPRRRHRVPRRDRVARAPPADAAPRRARCADRPAEPPAAERSPGPLDRAGAPLRPPPRGAVPRLRSLQAHQRHARPRDWRPGAALGGQAPDDLRARVGYGQPPRRRRVPDPAVGGRSSGGRRGDRREDRQLDRASRTTSRATSCS